MALSLCAWNSAFNASTYYHSIQLLLGSELDAQFLDPGPTTLIVKDKTEVKWTWTRMITRTSFYYFVELFRASVDRPAQPPGLA